MEELYITEKGMNTIKEKGHILMSAFSGTKIKIMFYDEDKLDG